MPMSFRFYQLKLRTLHLHLGASPATRCIPGGHDECSVSHQDVVTGTNGSSTECCRVCLQSRSFLIVLVVATILHNSCVEVLKMKPAVYLCEVVAIHTASTSAVDTRIMIHIQYTTLALYAHL